MTRKLSRKLSPLLLGGALAVGLSLSSRAQAEELRIGFIAPMTGIFAQIGKDMVNGFQMYLDEHGGKLGGVYVLTILYLPTGLMGIPARIRQARGASNKTPSKSGDVKNLASVPS